MLGKAAPPLAIINHTYNSKLSLLLSVTLYDYYYYYYHYYYYYYYLCRNFDSWEVTVDGTARLLSNPCGHE